MTVLAEIMADVERYALLRARLAMADDREKLLADNGLDEEAWERIDDGWQQRLSAAMEAPADGVPPLLQRFAEAFAKGQRVAPGRVLTLELFAQCTKAVQGARDPALALRKLGVSLHEYLRANQHWSPRFGRDRDLAKRFEAALARARRSVG